MRRLGEVEDSRAAVITWVMTRSSYFLVYSSLIDVGVSQSQDSAALDLQGLTAPPGNSPAVGPYSPYQTDPYSSVRHGEYYAEPDTMHGIDYAQSRPSHGKKLTVLFPNDNAESQMCRLSWLCSSYT